MSAKESFTEHGRGVVVACDSERVLIDFESGGNGSIHEYEADKFREPLNEGDLVSYEITFAVERAKPFRIDEVFADNDFGHMVPENAIKGPMML